MKSRENLSSPAFPVPPIVEAVADELLDHGAPGLTKLEYATLHLLTAALAKSDASIFREEGKLQMVTHAMTLLAVQTLETVRSLTEAAEKATEEDIAACEDMVEITGNGIHPPAEAAPLGVPLDAPDAKYRNYSQFILTVEKEFREQWQELELSGKCDAIDGQEYQRVFKDWLFFLAGQNPSGFVTRRANIGS